MVGGRLQPIRGSGLYLRAGAGFGAYVLEWEDSWWQDWFLDDCGCDPAIDTDVGLAWSVGAGYEYWYWHSCCGGEEGDIAIDLTSLDGDAIGADEEDGVTLEIAPELFVPRRLWNQINVGVNTGFTASDKLWFGLLLRFDQNAVPNYAVSATNLDFNNLGAMLAGRYKVGGPLTVGLSYMKFVALPRTITTSAWDIRDSDDPLYVDDRFSPQAPFLANTNGKYTAQVNIIGVRVGVDM
jgi:hypothetical protein